MSPEGALLTYALYIGIGFLIAGFVRIIQGFQAIGIVDNWGWIVLEEVLDMDSAKKHNDRVLDHYDKALDLFDFE